jgi:hypothetical protein
MPSSNGLPVGSNDINLDAGDRGIPHKCTPS